MKQLIFILILGFLVWYIINRFIYNFEPVSLKNNDNIRIVTWNIANFGWQNGYDISRSDAILKTILETKADIICLQEAVLSFDTCQINNIPLVMEKLNMGYYSYSYLRQYQFDDHHHFGDIVLSRYPICNIDTIATDDGKKQYFLMQILSQQDTIYVLNLHLQSNTIDTEAIKEYRFLSMYESYNKGADIREKDITTILKSAPKTRSLIVGDFNDVSFSKTLKSLGKSYQDAFETCGEGTNNTFANSFLRLRLDYVFYSPDIVCSRAIVMKTELSDHRPLVVDIGIKK